MLAFFHAVFNVQTIGRFGNVQVYRRDWRGDHLLSTPHTRKCYLDMVTYIMILVNWCKEHIARNASFRSESEKSQQILQDHAMCNA